MTLHSLCFKLWTFSFWFLLALTFVVLLVHQIDYRNSSGISKSPNIEIFSLPLDSFDYAEKVCPIQQLGQPTENTSVGSRTDAMLLESLRHKTVAFVGDSRIRHLCMRLLSALERIPFLLTSSNNHFHRDRRFYSKEFNTSLKFYWVVYPYEPRLKKILSRWARTTDPSPHIALFQFGAHSAWFPKHREKEHAYFKDGLTKTAKALKRIQYSQGTISVWMLTLAVNHLKPLTYEPFKWVQNKTVRDYLQLYAQLGQEIMNSAGVPVWSTALDATTKYLDLYHDNVHPGPALLDKFACQLLQALSWNQYGSYGNSG
ncbi:hypothetical protein RvY_06870-1 [Ramazzottius varieornatus]|uniref:SGNH domain-containing protein n=1 Tax=Ramazzottius varieornatus TaxID=947166 RepID=A0A1D1V028_RAMVA|nr:hypothetical protein RvY_06870-1 [Ramazzottius varieornatus]